MKVKRIFKSVMALTLAFLMVFTIPCISMADPITDSSMLPVEEIANGDASDYNGTPCQDTKLNFYHEPFFDNCV